MGYGDRRAVCSLRSEDRVVQASAAALWLGVRALRSTWLPRGLGDVM